jgi:hypothetical protein
MQHSVSIFFSHCVTNFSTFGSRTFENTIFLVLAFGGLPHFGRALEMYLDHHLRQSINQSRLSKPNDHSDLQTSTTFASVEPHGKAGVPAKVEERVKLLRRICLLQPC